MCKGPVGRGLESREPGKLGGWLRGQTGTGHMGPGGLWGASRLQTGALGATDDSGWESTCQTCVLHGCPGGRWFSGLAAGRGGGPQDLLVTRRKRQGDGPLSATCGNEDSGWEGRTGWGAEGFGGRLPRTESAQYLGARDRHPAIRSVGVWRIREWHGLRGSCQCGRRFTGALHAWSALRAGCERAGVQGAAAALGRPPHGRCTRWAPDRCPPCTDRACSPRRGSPRSLPRRRLMLCLPGRSAHPADASICREQVPAAAARGRRPAHAADVCWVPWQVPQASPATDAPCPQARRTRSCCTRCSTTSTRACSTTRRTPSSRRS